MAGDLPVENLTLGHCLVAIRSNTGTRSPTDRAGDWTRVVPALGLIFVVATLTACAAPGSTPTPPSSRPPPMAPAEVEAEPETTAPVVPAVEADASPPTPAAEPEPMTDPEPRTEPEARAPEPEDREQEPVAASPVRTEEEPTPRAEATPAPAEPAVVVPAPAAAARRSLRGQVTLQGGQAELTQTVVYFEAENSTDRPPPGTVDIETRDKTFDPTVVVVPRGSEVRFPNRDPILHNVFSVSGDNAFDLGVYGPDTAPATTLERPGAVNVYCNVHHDMHAHVLVLDTPWYVQVGADGRFALDDLPPGPGTLTVWHRQAEAWTLEVGDSAPGSIEVNLNIVRPQLPEHMDKTGQSYFRRDRDPYR